MRTELLISLRQVSREYREADHTRCVLRTVDLQVHEGESIALLGRSGSGKSTLLNLLGGIDQPDSGEIYIAGRRLDGLGEPQRTLFRRRHIGFVYQFFYLIPTLSVAENIRLPMELIGIPEPQIRREVRSLLEEIGLQDRSADFPDRLSGGEQQRVAIARAVVHRPALVLADEPTGNLDAATGKQVLDLLSGLSRSHRHTLVLVTHSLQVARRADRVLTLADGIVTEAEGEFAW
ncbi:MAG: ABC transporter ATP-binding protein [Gammaproteobacteria bacterium]|nr:ABC transporter ATP-binding protein [Gammaproteobacteria bacterium]